MIKLADAPDLLTPVFRKIFDGKYKQVPEKFSQIFNVEKTSLYQEKDSEFTGFTKASAITEGGSVSYEDALQGYDITYTQSEFGLGFIVTKQMLMFDQYGIMKKLPAKLADAMARRRETDAFNILNNGFVTTYNTGGDGVSLFSASHPSPNGAVSNQSNIITSTGGTVNMDFAEDALEALEIQAKTAKDAQGERIEINIDTIVVPPQLVATAERILQSDKRVETADNDANLYRNKYKLISSPYLTNAAYWYAFDSSMNNLNWFWSQQPKLEGPEVVFDTSSLKYKSTMLYTRGWSGWRGWFGSKGTNS